MGFLVFLHRLCEAELKMIYFVKESCLVDYDQESEVVFSMSPSAFAFEILKILTNIRETIQFGRSTPAWAIPMHTITTTTTSTRWAVLG